MKRHMFGDSAENSIMQTITIAVSAILIAAGLVTAPGLINNARDNNARTDLANIAYAQEFYLSTTGHYYDVDYTNTFLTIEQEIEYYSYMGDDTKTKDDAVNNLQYQAKNIGLNGLGTSVVLSADDVAGVAFTLSGDVSGHAVETCADTPYYLLKDQSASGTWFYRGSGSAKISSNYWDIYNSIPSEVFMSCGGFGDYFEEGGSGDYTPPWNVDDPIQVTYTFDISAQGACYHYDESDPDLGDYVSTSCNFSGYSEQTQAEVNALGPAASYVYASQGTNWWYYQDLISGWYYDDEGEKHIMDGFSNWNSASLSYSPSQNLLFTNFGTWWDTIDYEQSNYDDLVYGSAEFAQNGGEIKVAMYEQDSYTYIGAALLVFKPIAGNSPEWPAWGGYPELFDVQTPEEPEAPSAWTSTYIDSGRFNGFTNFKDVVYSPITDTYVTWSEDALTSAQRAIYPQPVPIFASNDGENWSQVSGLPDWIGSSTVTDIGYGNGVFMLITNRQKSWMDGFDYHDGITKGYKLADYNTAANAFTSTDGLNWYEISLPDVPVTLGSNFYTDGTYWSQINFVDGELTISGTRGGQYSSSYCSTRTSADQPYVDDPRIAVWNGGSSWSVHDLNGVPSSEGSLCALHPKNIAYGNGVYVGTVGQSVMYSYDLINWSSSNINGEAGTAARNVRDNESIVVFANGTFVIGDSFDGSNRGVVYSNDGINFQSVGFSNACTPTSIVYAGDEFVTLGGDASCNQKSHSWSSSDGATWTQTLDDQLRFGAFNSMTYAEGHLFAINKTGDTIYTYEV